MKDIQFKTWYKKNHMPIIGFITFLAITILITLIFNWLWTGLGNDPKRTLFPNLTNDLDEFKDYATLYISLLSFSATLFAGLAVFLVFTHWKEQRKYDLEKQYAEDLLDSIGKIHMELINTFNSYHILEYLKINYVVLNELMGSMDNDISINLFKILVKLKTMQNILEKKIPDTVFKNFEDDTLKFAAAIDEINQAYKAYYKLLDDSYKKDKNNKLIVHSDHRKDKDFIDCENYLFEVYNNSIKTGLQEDYKSDHIEYDLTLEEYKENFENNYEIFIKELVKIIKL